MKRVCFLVVLFFHFSGSYSQVFNFSGLVTYNHIPLPNATIFINGSNNSGTNTNMEGQFSFTKLKAGNYTLSCSYTGLANFDTTIAIPFTENEFIIDLKALPENLQPVEVTALRAGLLAPFAKTDISKSLIEKNNSGKDIPFLLDQTPNVVINSDAGNGIGYTGIRIRGSDATRINMTINGIPYNDAESQGTFFVNMPDFLSSTSSIQIQRGVGTSSNGAGAFGASMNFSTNEYRDKAYLEFNNGYGSFNSIKNTLSFGSGLINNKFTFDARLSRIVSDGYIDRAKSNLLGGYFSGAWITKKGTLRLNVMLGKEKTYQAWYGISEGDLKNNRTFNAAGTEKPGEPYDNETDNYWQNHYQLHYNRTISSTIQFNTAFYLTTGKGYYEQYKADQNLADYGLPGPSSTDLIRQLWLKNKLFGQIFSLQYRKNKDEITFGGGWNIYPGNHFGQIVDVINAPGTKNQNWYDLDARKTDINLYAKWQRKLAKSLYLFTDMQVRGVFYTLNGFRNNPSISISERYLFANPKAGITYQKSNIQVFASYALANKEPNRDDFEAALTAKPMREQLHDIEMGLHIKELLPHLSIGLNTYWMQYKDQLILTGKVNDVGAYTRTNIPDSYRAGIELEANYHWEKGEIQYSGSFSKNRIKEFSAYYDDYDNGGQIIEKYTNTPIALSPSMVQSIGLNFRPVSSIEFSLMNKYVGKQFLDNTGLNSRSLDAFTTTDIRVSYRLPRVKWAKEITLTVNFYNIFNSYYEPNGYTFSYLYNGAFTTENYYYPMAGRNWMAGLKISL